MRISHFANSRALLILASLVLSWLSLPGGRAPLLAFVSLVPLGLALHNSSPRMSFFYAYACGFQGWIMFAPGLIDGFASYTDVSTLRSLALIALGCAWLALPYGIFGLLYGKFHWLNDRAGPIKTAACLTVLVSIFPTPLPLNSSHSLYEFPRLIQVMDIGGQPLLLFIVYLCNWMLVDLALKWKARKSLRKNFAWLVCIAILLMGYGSLRLWQHHRESISHRAVKIAIVQPNISVAREAVNYPSEVLEKLLDQSRDVISKNSTIDLITWPEVPVRMTCDDGSHTNLKLNEFARQHNVALLINCTQLSRDGRDYNTELFVARDGSTATYHKQILFPFTEFIPGEHLFPQLRTIFPGVSRFAAGTEATIFPLENGNVFAAVCYEILFPNHPRKFTQAGGDVLISPANDAWFGRNRIPDFEVAAAVFQAVQHRIPVVRVSNSGNSVAVYSSGELLNNSRTPNFTATTSAFQMTTPQVRSFYSKVGDVFLYLLVLGLSVSVVVETRRKRSLTAVRTFKVDRQSTPSSL